jgi:cobalt-zinc-cadmium efflux system outer membrane protein
MPRADDATTGKQEPGKDILPPPKAPKMYERLEPAIKMLPEAGKAPKLEMPGWQSDKPVTPEYVEAVNAAYPPLPGRGKNPGPTAPSPTGKPLTLADLQRLAFTNSPKLREAAHDVQGALGAYIQVGAYPNPTVAYLASSQSTSGGPLIGYSVAQTVKIGGKLKLAQAAAQKDLENARLAYRRAETDLMASVRGGYFAVLVAQESIRANYALVVLTDDVYTFLLERLRAGQIAPYEPSLLLVFAAQAREALVTARNSYTLAWRQLAASLGLPGMPPTELARRADERLPLYTFDKAVAHVLLNHTDVKTAENGILKARYNLRAAEVLPIPDLTFAGTVQEDLNPGGLASSTVGVNVGGVVPVWDLNKGAIRQAQAALGKANEEVHRVRDDLSSAVADAYRRYAENRDLVELNRRNILPMQILAFQQAIKRYQESTGALAYTDLVSAEQNLVTVIGPYIATLGAMWQAVTDLASLLQTDDLYQVADGELHLPPLPELDQLLSLPCNHVCSPVPTATLAGIDLNFPPAGFGPDEGQKQSQAPRDLGPAPVRSAVLLAPVVVNAGPEAPANRRTPSEKN